MMEVQEVRSSIKIHRPHYSGFNRR